jgi:hypothetical protein
MLLKVMYQDDKYDMVRPSLLNELISSKKIKRFYRSGEWSDIERDPIRGSGGSYIGPERRKQSSLSSRLTILTKEINCAK